MNWQEFVIAEGSGVASHVIAAVVGEPVSSIKALRNRGVLRARNRATRTFSELFSLFNGRAPEDSEWPTPRRRKTGHYEWQEPELRLLASLVGRIGPAEIAVVLTRRLRELTGDPAAERTRNAIQIAIQKVGLQADDIVGGVTIAQAARECGTSRAVFNQLVRQKGIATYRVGRFLAIPRAALDEWRAKVVNPPKGFVRLCSIREKLGIKSDAKLPEFAAAGYIPTAMRCHSMGGPSTRYGTWYIDATVARLLVADRHAGRPMPWHNKPNEHNLRVTYKLWRKRQHPEHCEQCRAIWGEQGAPKTFDDYAKRYPPLVHGVKRHLTRRWTAGLELPEVARHCGVSLSTVHRAIEQGTLTSTTIGRTRYVSKTVATRWKARNCASGEGAKSWTSVECAVKRYGLSREDIARGIAAGTLASKLGTNGAMRGVTYVLKQQCVELRERMGFTMDDAARRARMSVERLRALLRGTQHDGSERVPLQVLQAAIKRRDSRRGHSISEAAAFIGVDVQWVEDRIRDGTVRVSTTAWGHRRYLTEPMLDRLVQAYFRPKQRKPRMLAHEWLMLSAAASVAGVSTTSLQRWCDDGDVRTAAQGSITMYHVDSVKDRARRYWQTCRFKRAVPPAWLQEESARGSGGLA